MRGGPPKGEVHRATAKETEGGGRMNERWYTHLSVVVLDAILARCSSSTFLDGAVDRRGASGERLGMTAVGMADGCGSRVVGR